MADVFQGAPLPTITTTEQKQQVLPEFYTNYLQDIANIGTGAIQQGGVAGFSPLQQQAFQMAPQAAFSGAQTAGDAASLLGASGTTAAPSMVGAYMNPYMTNVVDEMARLQNQNIQRSVLPALRGAGVGSGSFGSTRQANATGQAMSEMQRNLLGKQYEALYSGYGDAMKTAQTDLNRQMQAGQGLGNVAQQQYSIGTGGLKTLEDLGAQQQALGQKQLDYPMIQAQNLAKLFQGLNIPSGETLQKVGPGQAGQYSLSPLSQISGLLTGLGAFTGQPSGTAGTTTGGAQQQTGLQSILGLPQAAFDQLMSLGRSIGLPLAEGGTVGYAKGGNVKPVPANFQNYLKNKAKRNS
jgi:hypothetical protein